MSYKTNVYNSNKRFYDYYRYRAYTNLVPKTSAFAIYEEYCHEEFEEYRDEYKLIYKEEFGEFPDEDKSVYSMMVEIEDKMFLNEEVRKKEIKSKILSLEEYEKIISSRKSDLLKEHVNLWTTQLEWCGYPKLFAGSPNIKSLWRLATKAQKKILKTARYMENYENLKLMNDEDKIEFVKKKRYIDLGMDIFDMFELVGGEVYDMLILEMPPNTVAKDNYKELLRYVNSYSDRCMDLFWSSIKFYHNKDNNNHIPLCLFNSMARIMSNKPEN